MQHPTSADIQRVREFLLDLQAHICAALEQRCYRAMSWYFCIQHNMAKPSKAWQI
jgi:hypothetical protein